MVTLHAKIKCEESAISKYLDNLIDENEEWSEELTNLDAEADWFCENFINTYIISDGVIDIKIKDEDIDKLKSYMKHLIYLKYKKLELE